MSKLSFTVTSAVCVVSVVKYAHKIWIFIPCDSPSRFHKYSYGNRGAQLHYRNKKPEFSWKSIFSCFTADLCRTEAKLKSLQLIWVQFYEHRWEACDRGRYWTTADLLGNGYHLFCFFQRKEKIKIHNQGWSLTKSFGNFHLNEKPCCNCRSTLHFPIASETYSFQ